MIIVTGGAGFIGSNLVAELEKRGAGDIVVCDWLGDEDKWRNISKRGLRDIVKPENLADYLEKHKSEVECIFHMGAISSTTERDADLIIENNFTLSRLLWAWCAENNVRFIYASSAATYGDGSKGFNDDDTEEKLSSLQPLNPYGWSKHLFDRRVSRIVSGESKSSDGVPPQWAGLKFFNVYGPNEYHKNDQMSVICKLYPQVTAGAAAKLFKSPHPDYEDGGQLRDFVYVRDCVDVMCWLYDNPNVSGLFNVGTGKARSFKDLALATFTAADKEPKINYIDMPQALQGKYQYFTEANMDKLREAGYSRDFTSLEEGVRDYVQNYMSQDDPYR
ncbi:MAG: ADP-glyceromanno-heptose 6-epimerase [Micavibrio sp.]|nr:ADP-glyceromanno-heptose 6-epimerase [Micavibrio sp.]